MIYWFDFCRLHTNKKLKNGWFFAPKNLKKHPLLKSGQIFFLILTRFLKYLQDSSILSYIENITIAHGKATKLKYVAIIIVKIIY